MVSYGYSCLFVVTPPVDSATNKNTMVQLRVLCEQVLRATGHVVSHSEKAQARCCSGTAQPRSSDLSDWIGSPCVYFGVYHYLQVWHHTVVMPLFWSLNNAHMDNHFVLVLANTGVHVLVYGYFTASILGVCCGRSRLPCDCTVLWLTVCT